MNDDNLYFEFLKNKRVVIVGPAQSMVGSKQGSLIDNYDVVVRIKKVLSQFPHLSEDIGTRTNVLYSWLDREPSNGGKINFESLEKDNVEFVCSAYPKGLWFSEGNIEIFLNENKGKFKFHAMDKEAYLNVEGKIQTRPNTGICAILDILTHCISELYITGFTFFKGGYIKEYTDLTEHQALERMRALGFHSQQPQISLLKEIIVKDKRIKIDKALEKIILSS